VAEEFSDEEEIAQKRQHPQPHQAHHLVVHQAGFLNLFDLRLGMTHQAIMPRKRQETGRNEYAQDDQEHPPPIGLKAIALTLPDGCGFVHTGSERQVSWD
jgi:hypothetical protein